MTTVAIMSIVRNGSSYLPRYFRQVDALSGYCELLGMTVTPWVTEGDSTDDTARVLSQWKHPHKRLVHYSHGGPAFGSINHPTRWRQIAATWNYMLDRMPEYDRVIYVEADLIWTPETMAALLDQLDADVVHACSPMSFGHDGRFYDTWGHRCLGDHFIQDYPYHPAIEALANRDEEMLAALGGTSRNGLLRIDSAGSCMVMIGRVAQDCRLANEDAMIGHDLKRLGYQLWLNPGVSVWHP